MPLASRHCVSRRARFPGLSLEPAKSPEEVICSIVFRPSLRYRSEIRSAGKSQRQNGLVWAVMEPCPRVR